MIFALHIVQPPTDTEEALIGGEKLLSLGSVDKSDRIQEFHPIRFTLQFPQVKMSANVTKKKRFG